MVRAWLGAAVPQGDGLLFPGDQRRRTAGLHLAPDGVEVRAGSVVGRLRWEDHRLVAPERLSTQPDAWWLARFGGSADVRFLGVGVSGGAVAATEAVRAATESWRTRVARLQDHRAFVPLFLGTVSLGHDATVQTAGTFLSVLAARPDVRARLVERDRVIRVVDDMARHPLAPGHSSTGVRRRTVETLAAMRALGFVHRVEGRPVPGDPAPPPLDEIVRRVIGHVKHNPYAAVILDPAQVAKLVRRHYLDVEPWPFGAITVADWRPAEPPPDPAPDAGTPDAGTPEPGPPAGPPAETPEEAPVERPAPNGYGAGHRPSWWRSTPPWAPSGDAGP